MLSRDFYQVTKDNQPSYQQPKIKSILSVLLKRLKSFIVIFVLEGSILPLKLEISIYNQINLKNLSLIVRLYKTTKSL